MLQDAETTNLYFGLGLMLVAAEVPRIAQMFGLDTSTRGNISSVVHTTSSVFTLVRQFAH